MDITVTDSFLGQSESLRECQKKEKFENCLSTDYINTMLKKCGCMSFHLAMHLKVFSCLINDKVSISHSLKY